MIISQSSRVYKSQGTKSMFHAPSRFWLVFLLVCGTSPVYFLPIHNTYNTLKALFIINKLLHYYMSSQDATKS